MRFIFCECYQHSYWLIQIKINVKLKKCKSLYIATIHHWNQLFIFVKIVWSKLIREMNGGNPLKLFFVSYRYLDQLPGLRGTRSRFKALQHDLWMKFNEWPTFFLDTRTTLFQKSRLQFIWETLRVVNETRCEWNIREISDKDRND